MKLRPVAMDENMWNEVCNAKNYDKFTLFFNLEFLIISNNHNYLSTINIMVNY